MSLFRRRDRAETEEPATGPDAPGLAESGAEPDATRTGPWDADELSDADADAEGVTGGAAGGDAGAAPGTGRRVRRVDLGALRLVPRDGMELQLQVDEGSGQVSSALVVLGDSAVQLIVVAAPRSLGLWDDTRGQLAADTTRRGGTATEVPGPLGTELHLALPVSLPDGRKGVQPSRVVGIDGPRWMLRATFLGRAVTEEPAFETLADFVRDLVVVRGKEPMAPGELLPLRLPAEAGQPAAEEEPGTPARPTLRDLDPGPTITEIH